MIRIINNTDISFERLLVLYASEIRQAKAKGVIECIVFDECAIDVWAVDRLLISVKE